MEPGGIEFTLQAPTTSTTMDAICKWWQGHWPNAFIEEVDDGLWDTERFIWKNWAASEIDDTDIAEYEMVYVIVAVDSVTLVVDEPEVELAKACLAFLSQEWN